MQPGERPRVMPVELSLSRLNTSQNLLIMRYGYASIVGTSSGNNRAISPVVGVALLLGILVALVTAVSVGLLGFGSELSAEPFERVVADESDAAEAKPPYEYGDNITAVDTGAGATTSHVVTLNITGNTIGNSLNQITIDYTQEETDVSDTAAGSSLSDLRTIGIDTDKNGEIDKDAMGDVEQDDFNAENNGGKLVIELSGNYDLNADDELVIIYEEVENPPSTGTYTADINLNGDRVYDGTLSID